MTVRAISLADIARHVIVRRLPQEPTVFSVNALDDVAGTVLPGPNLGSSLEAYGRAQTLLMFLLSEGPTFAWAAGGSAAAGKELHDRVGRQVAAAAEALAPGFPAGPCQSFPHCLSSVYLFVLGLIPGRDASAHVTRHQAFALAPVWS